MERRIPTTEYESIVWAENEIRKGEGLKKPLPGMPKTACALVSHLVQKKICAERFVVEFKIWPRWLGNCVMPLIFPPFPSFPVSPLAFPFYLEVAFLPLPFSPPFRFLRPTQGRKGRK